MARRIEAVFLDRDGTINVERRDYVKRWEEFEFLPRVFEALERLAQLDSKVFIITNQSMVARGLASLEQLQEIHRKMRLEIESNGGRIDGIYVCPHHPRESCPCRKPQPGLLLRASREHRIDLHRTVLFGNGAADLRAASAAGCSSIFVSQGTLPDAFHDSASVIAVVRDLYDAVGVMERVIESNLASS